MSFTLIPKFDEFDWICCAPASKEAAPPGWKRRPTSLVLAWLNPSTADEANDQGWKRLADGAWGQEVQGLGQHPAGHLGLGRCKRMSTGRTDRCCRSRREAHVGGNCWSRGRESGCFSGVLRWSVGRHGLLRSRYKQFWCVRVQRQSVLKRIANGARFDRDWICRALFL